LDSYLVESPDTKGSIPVSEINVPKHFEREFNIWKATVSLELGNIQTRNTDANVHSSVKNLLNRANKLSNASMKSINDAYLESQFIGNIATKYGIESLVLKESDKEEYGKILDEVTSLFPVNEERDISGIMNYLGYSENKWKLMSRGFVNGLPGGLQKSILNLYESQIKDSPMFYIGDKNYEMQEELLREFIALLKFNENLLANRGQ
jgi:hypothetical protein